MHYSSSIDECWKFCGIEISFKLQRVETALGKGLRRGWDDFGSWTFKQKHCEMFNKIYQSWQHCCFNVFLFPELSPARILHQVLTLRRGVTTRLSDITSAFYLLQSLQRQKPSFWEDPCSVSSTCFQTEILAQDCGKNQPATNNAPPVKPTWDNTVFVVHENNNKETRFCRNQWISYFKSFVQTIFPWTDTIHWTE